METSPTGTHTLRDFLYLLAVPVAGALGALLRHIWSQRASAPLTLAQADREHATAAKERAEARQIDSNILDQAWERIDELSRRNDLQRIELESRDAQVKKLRAILTINNIKYADYDHLKF